LFNELTKLFSGQRKERRQFPRKKVRFSISWIKGPNELMPGIGMEISLNGCLWATRTPPGTPDYDCIMDIERRKIRLRLKTARSGTILRENQQWTLLGCTFSGIAADDYDALVRFCKDMHEPENKAARELAALDRTDEGVITAAFDLDFLKTHRAAWGFFRDRRPDLYAQAGVGE